MYVVTDQFNNFVVFGNNDVASDNSWLIPVPMAVKLSWRNLRTAKRVEG